MIGALSLLERHPNEVRVACLRYGKSVEDMGTRRFPWMDAVAVLSTVAPGDPLYDVEHPSAAGWDHHAMLLAALLDVLNVLAWQGGDRKRSDFPRPTPRPGVENTHERKFGGTPIEMDDMQAFLDRKRAGTPAAA